ncbi:unnamed protein product, partial [Pylaiella littoralis]
DVVDGVVAVESVSTGTPAEDVTQGEELPASAKAGAPEIADLDTSLVHAEEEPLPEDAAPAALPAEDVLPVTAEKDPQAPVVAAAAEAEGGSNDLSLVAAEEGDPAATPTAVTPEQPMVDSREDALVDPVAEAAASAAEVDVPGTVMAVDIPAESTSASAEQGGVVDVAQDASVCDAMVADAAAAASTVEEAGSGDEAPEYEEAPDAGCTGGEEDSEAATDVPMDEAVVPTDAVPPTEAEAS